MNLSEPPRSGQRVRIIDGSFQGFTGVIDSVDLLGERATVIIEVFGRSTPVDVEFSEIRRIVSE